jgi:TetR/AcrR family transcriptional regulator, regulator of cefoperazone and chloramphenicol sensitivity
MVQREDGEATRKRLLDAACEIFADKGYHDGKVADICKRAGANVAAVNYHFRNKANLYAEAWRHAFKKFKEPIFTGSAMNQAEEQLRIYIHNLIENFLEQDKLGQFSRLYLRELVNPTGLIQDLWRKMIEPRRQKLLNVIREFMGKKIDDEEVLFCEMSIVNQCRLLLTIDRNDLEYLLGQPLSPELIKRLADHIVGFSLGGIKAVNK